MSPPYVSFVEFSIGYRYIIHCARCEVHYMSQPHQEKELFLVKGCKANFESQANAGHGYDDTLYLGISHSLKAVGNLPSGLLYDKFLLE